MALRCARNKTLFRLCTSPLVLHQNPHRCRGLLNTAQLTTSKPALYSGLTKTLVNRIEASTTDRSTFRCYCSNINDSDGRGSVLPEKLQAKKYIEYTCKVCNTRNNNTFSKLSYEKGIVIVTCQGCQNRHLIADNLGWFQQTSRNIEDMLAERGEEVRVSSDGGTQEIVLDDDTNTGSEDKP